MIGNTAEEKKGVALEDDHLIMVIGTNKLPFSRGPIDEKCIAASNPGPLLDLVDIKDLVRKVGSDERYKGGELLI